MSTFTDRRMGITRIAIDLINADPEGVRVVMAAIIVLRAQIFPTVIEYICLCEEFEPVRAGDVMSAYTARMHRGDDGIVRLLGWDKA